MEKKKTSLMFKIIKGLVRLFYGKMDVEGMENLPGQDCVLVANHAQMNGPIAGELFLPDDCYIWCAGEMMKLKEVPKYAFDDFWSQKPKRSQPFYKLASYLIAPLAACIFNNARTIPVYHDMRIMTTFKETINVLKDGGSVLIFPEKDEKNNNILYHFQENFIDVAKVYNKRTGRNITFVPVYIAPKLRKMYIGKGLPFQPEAPIEEERRRLCVALSDEITRMARDLPEHIVIPYRNIPKRHYLKNKDVTKVPQ